MQTLSGEIFLSRIHTVNALVASGKRVAVRGFFSAFERLSVEKQRFAFAELERFTIGDLHSVVLIRCEEETTSSVSALQRSKEAWHVFFHLYSDEFGAAANFDVDSSDGLSTSSDYPEH